MFFACQCNHAVKDALLDDHEACDEKEAEKLKYLYLSEEAIKNIRKKKKYYINVLPTWGSAGCAISHIKCWELFLKKKKNYCLILEDDIIIDDIEKFTFSFMKIYRIFKKNMTHGYHPGNNEHSQQLWVKKFENKNYIKNIMICFNSDIYPEYSRYNNYTNNLQTNTTSYYYNYNDFTNYYTNNYTNNYYNYNTNNELNSLHNLINNVIYDTDLQKINNSFTKTHCYMINKYVAEDLLDMLLPITFQIDVQLGLFAKKFPHIISIFNIQKSGINQDKGFTSDVQIFIPNKKFLYKTFSLSDEICDVIFKYMSIPLLN